jgi:CRISPR-associated protein Csb2
MLALGWGIDQVAADGRIIGESEVTALSGKRWHAWSTHRPGMQSSRVPTAESLQALERVHTSFLSRLEGERYEPPVKFGHFTTVTYMPATSLPPRPYAVFEISEGVAFRQETAAVVAAMLRSATCEQAKADTHEFPGGSEHYVAGHVQERGRTPPRFSYLPLPTIGHRYADGMIRRLLVAEPIGGDGTHSRWAQNRLRNMTLRDENGNERGTLLDLWRTTSRPLVARYVDESQQWCTVTPVVLPGFDDGKHAKAEKLLVSALTQAGLPVASLEELTIRKAPFWAGSAHPRQYVVPAYLRDLPRWHVRMRFHDSLTGPLAVGAGRHAGLGLFAAWAEDQTRDSASRTERRLPSKSYGRLR